MIGKNLKVEIKSKSIGNNFVNGYAHYGRGDFSKRNFIHINIPRNHRVEEARVANTFLHELAHTRGIRHEDMRCPVRCEIIPLTESITGKVFIEEKPFKADPTKQELGQKKVLKLEAAIKHKQSKIKRLTTLIKKQQKQVRYYKKKMGSD